MLYQLSYASPKQLVPYSLQTHGGISNQGVQNRRLAYAEAGRNDCGILGKSDSADIGNSLYDLVKIAVRAES